MTVADVPDSRFLKGYEWAYRHHISATAVGCRPVDLNATFSVAGFAVEHGERSLGAGVWPVRAVVARV